MKNDQDFQKVDEDIIFNNIMKGVSISQISSRNNMTNAEVNKRKRKIIGNFKNILSKKYKIKTMLDVM